MAIEYLGAWLQQTILVIQNWSVEWQTYETEGMNHPIVWSAAGALILLLPEMFGNVMQTYRIFRDQSAETLSVYWLGYTQVFMLACIPYGLSIHTFAVVFAATVIFIFGLPILYGIYKMRGYTKKEWIALAVFSIIPVLMLIAPSDIRQVTIFGFTAEMSWMGFTYTLISFWLIFQSATQPYMMREEGQSGDLEMIMTTTLTISLFFWVVFSIYTESLPLLILNLSLLVVQAFVFYYWWTLPRRNDKTNAAPI